MHVIRARNVHQALPKGVHLIETEGWERASRAGDVYVVNGPVTTLYEWPRERVLFWEGRDANPFFHLMEALWMLAGRDDLEFMTRYVRRFSQFSDDGVTLHGAYGHRWRHRFGFDQLGIIIATLRENPSDRRCVLQMWDARVDLGREGRDLPCNTQIYFGINVAGALDMTVCCRSNDMVWGAYGANAVHFSVLQEFVAAAISRPVGRYWQMSNNFHAYAGEALDSVRHLSEMARGRAPMADPYEMGEVLAYPLVSTPPESWLRDLDCFLEDPTMIGFQDKFFRRVAVPMELAHRAFKEGEPDHALEILEQCAATDWRRAGEEWIKRRVRRAAEKARAEDDGVRYE